MVALLNIFASLLPLVGVIVSLIIARLGFRMLFKRKKPAAVIERCRCGYALQGLSAARCPECGRVFGFDAAAEELGLTAEQLERAQSARMKRKA